jgi:RNA polymerase sigma-70 factor (ECF subfamily)
MAQEITETATLTAGNEPASNYEAGNEADFERLYQTSYGKILGTLTVMLGDRAAAEDCAQDAFERAYKKWSTWQPIAPAEAWVHRIAINGAVSYQRKMRLREVGEVIRRIGRPALGPDPQVLVENGDIAAALAQLPPKQAAAIVLRHYHGYTNRAIAQALGIPERTVASRLAVAKARLRELLKHSYGPEAAMDGGVSRPALAGASG